MRQSLLWMVPLVLLAACDDATPVQPRTDMRGVRASVADAQGLTECQQPSTIPLGTDQRLSDPHSLTKVTVVEAGGQSLVFQTPTNIAFAHGGGPSVACQEWGRTAGGRGIVYVSPDSATDTVRVDFPALPDSIVTRIGPRTLTYLWELVRDYRRRCWGCTASDTAYFRDLWVGQELRRTLATSLSGVVARFDLDRYFPDGTPAHADKLLSSFVAACKTSAFFRQHFGLDDDRDRRSMVGVAEHLSADNRYGIDIQGPYRKNWEKGVTAAFRSWTPDCTQSFLTAWQHRDLDFITWTQTGSGGGGGGGGRDGWLPPDPFAPPGEPGPPNPWNPVRTPAQSTRSPG